MQRLAFNRMGNPITDFFTGDSPERRALREAKRGVNDIGYDSDTGTLKIMRGEGANEKYSKGEVVYAEKNGVPGSMRPGWPYSWEEIPHNMIGRNAVVRNLKARHDAVKRGNEAENARYHKGFLRSGNTPSPQPSTPSPAPSSETSEPKPRNLKTFNGITYDMDYPPHRRAYVQARAAAQTAAQNEKRDRVIKPTSREEATDVPGVDQTASQTDQKDFDDDSVNRDSETVIEPTSTSSSDTERTNKNGIVQKGMTLGGIKNFLQGTGLELADGQRVFGKNGGPAAGGSGPNESDLKVMGYGEDNAKILAGGGALETVIDKNGIGKSVPYTTGRSDSKQEGADPTPDRADMVRDIDFHDEGFGNDERFSNFTAGHPDTAKLTAQMYADSARNKARAAFLNPNNKGYDSIKQSNAAVGVVNMGDQGGALKYGDKFLTSKSGMSGSDFAYKLRGGQKGYDAIKDDLVEVGEDGIIDTPVTTGEPDDVAPEVQKILPTKEQVTNFAQDFVKTYKDSLKDKIPK